MILEPFQNLQVYCYADIDFSGLWGVEEDQDTTFIKSRTGFIIIFMGCPLTWVSKSRSQIDISTMEAEYILLPQSVREVVSIREFIKEIQN